MLRHNFTCFGCRSKVYTHGFWGFATILPLCNVMSCGVEEG